MGATSSREVGRTARSFAVGLAAVALVLVAVASMLLWVELRGDDTFDPLGEYAEQDVTAEENADGLPVVAIDDPVEVVGTKCNDSDEPVRITGVLSWQARDPAGAVIEVGRGERVAEPGCIEQTFENLIPPEVRGLIAGQHEAGIPAPVWRISGREVPIDGNGAEGVARTFVTEDFVVVP